MEDNRMKLTLLSPRGIMDARLAHAPRLDTLAGKTICELSNASWEYNRVFPAVRELLQKRYPTLKIIPYAEMTPDRMDIDNLDNVARMVKEKGCQGVISGMAA
ncbi:MAG: hypothetical protein HYY32_02225 [Chloroflexi bacterium]|nr:hypothetical protein [Chloroflexota bacterium]